MSFSSDKPALEDQIPISLEFPEEDKAFKQKLYDTHQRVASSVNGKIGGLYVPTEKTTSAQYFDPTNPQKNKNVYRMVVDFGALPNSSSKSVPHNISGWNDRYRLRQSYGASTSPSTLEAVPIPNEGIFLKINSSNVSNNRG